MNNTKKMNMEELGEFLKKSGKSFDLSICAHVDKFHLINGECKLSGFWSESLQSNFYTDEGIIPCFCPYTGQKLVIRD